MISPYLTTSDQAASQGASCRTRPDASNDGSGRRQPRDPVTAHRGTRPALKGKLQMPPRDHTRVCACRAYETGARADPVLYAHANRVLHLETNPGNARALVQRL